ncbi:hypothetical protein IGB42_02981 [Andreprevotia sp. IGB-42]|uniref:GNAT family N-acetyltransferase n=1 Tax=Andreprevotia sp. IGB-42 TaxID=2497473 RepID=UPI0013591D05|nr:GNAT family N-acetyltransferase [Andreprevotia sp. IGB-42]KAF0812689.1 hypothetical protein IGB42_02981 [Andreprevotia sp. IGB-42]
MSAHLTIRPCSPDDLIAAIDLLMLSAEQHFYPDMDDAARAAFLQENSLAKALWLQQQGYVYLAAWLGKRFAGFISISPAAHIHQLFVVDALQKTGIGRTLLDAAIGAVAAAYPTAQVTVYASNNAIGFYARNGFQRTSETLYWYGSPYNPMSLVLATARAPALARG